MIGPGDGERVVNAPLNFGSYPELTLPNSRNSQLSLYIRVHSRLVHFSFPVNKLFRYGFEKVGPAWKPVLLYFLFSGSFYP